MLLSLEILVFSYSLSNSNTFSQHLEHFTVLSSSGDVCRVWESSVFLFKLLGCTKIHAVNVSGMSKRLTTASVAIMTMG